MKIAVALLTCDRYDYTQRVLQSLWQYNGLMDKALVYADDNSQDASIHEMVQSHGFEPVFLNTGSRIGCSPMTEALWRGAANKVGNDGIIVSLQNDFECIRSLPWGLIEKALECQDVACVKLWDARRGGGRIGPRVKLLRKAEWRDSDEYDEPVEVARTGWGFGPIAMKAEIACRIVRRATREYGVMKQSCRLDSLVVRPKRLSFRHIGKVKTHAGIYKSSVRYAG